MIKYWYLKAGLLRTRMPLRVDQAEVPWPIPDQPSSTRLPRGNGGFGGAGVELLEGGPDLLGIREPQRVLTL